MTELVLTAAAPTFVASLLRTRPAHGVVDLTGPVDALPASEDARRWERVVIITSSAGALRAVLPRLRHVGGHTRHVDLLVGATSDRSSSTHLLSPPRTLVGGRRLRSLRWEVLDRPRPHLSIAISLTRGQRLMDTVMSVVQDRIPPVEPSPNELRIGVAGDAPHLLRWVSGLPDARVLPRPTDPGSPPVDLIISDGTSTNHPLTPAVRDDRRGLTWTDMLDMSRARGTSTVDRLSRAPLPPVDVRVLNPIGFRPQAGSEVARVRRHREHLAIGAAARSGPPVEPWCGLAETHVHESRSFQAVIDDGSVHPGPLERASFLVQAASAGLPLLARHLDPSTRALVGQALADRLTSTSAAALADMEAREVHCLALSRLAMLAHSHTARWAQVTQSSSALPTVSVLVPTRRPELLSRVARYVGAQDWPQVELVLGLHGIDDDHPGVVAFRRSFDRPVRVHHVHRDKNLGQVLDELTALATGAYVAKMDDDDYYSTHHLTDLVLAHQFSGADLVGSGAEYVYLEAIDTTIRRHSDHGHRFYSRVPGAALLIGRQTLRDAGGWRPDARGIDTALSRSVLGSGGSIYRTHGLSIVVHRSAQGHTWDPGIEYFLRGRPLQWSGSHQPPGFPPAEPRESVVPTTSGDRLLSRASGAVPSTVPRAGRDRSSWRARPVRPQV